MPGSKAGHIPAQTGMPHVHYVLRKEYQGFIQVENFSNYPAAHDMGFPKDILHMRMRSDVQCNGLQPGYCVGL